MMLCIICALAVVILPSSALHAHAGGQGDALGKSHSVEMMSKSNGSGHSHTTHSDEDMDVANADEDHGGAQCCSSFCVSIILVEFDMIPLRSEPTERYAAFDRLIVPFDLDSPKRPPRA
jgi:hypothetical protein